MSWCETEMQKYAIGEKFEVFILGGQRNDQKRRWRGSRVRIEMEAGER